MNIQGNQRSIRKFVIDVLPDIYKKVCQDSSIGKALRSDGLTLNARVKLSAETTYIVVKYAAKSISGNLPSRSISK